MTAVEGYRAGKLLVELVLGTSGGMFIGKVLNDIIPESDTPGPKYWCRLKWHPFTAGVSGNSPRNRS